MLASQHPNSGAGNYALMRGLWSANAHNRFEKKAARNAMSVGRCLTAYESAGPLSGSITNSPEGLKWDKKRRRTDTQ